MFVYIYNFLIVLAFYKDFNTRNLTFTYQIFFYYVPDNLARAFPSLYALINLICVARISLISRETDARLKFKIVNQTKIKWKI